MKLFAAREMLGSGAPDCVELYMERPEPMMLTSTDPGVFWGWRLSQGGPPYAIIYGWSRLFPSLVIAPGTLKEIEIEDTKTFPGSFKISIYGRTPECTTPLQSALSSQESASCASHTTSPISTPASTSSENNTKL